MAAGVPHEIEGDRDQVDQYRGEILGKIQSEADAHGISGITETEIAQMTGVVLSGNNLIQTYYSPPGYPNVNLFSVYDDIMDMAKWRWEFMLPLLPASMNGLFGLRFYEVRDNLKGEGHQWYVFIDLIPSRVRSAKEQGLNLLELAQVELPLLTKYIRDNYPDHTTAVVLTHGVWDRLVKSLFSHMFDAGTMQEVELGAESLNRANAVRILVTALNAAGVQKDNVVPHLLTAQADLLYLDNESDA